MNRLSFRYALVATLFTGVASIGCQKKSPDPAANSAAATSAQPTPEESFDDIVETFRRGVEDVPIGFVVQDSYGGQTMMTGKNVVTHKLLPPDKEGDPLKAEITVESDTQYSVQRSSEKPDAKAAGQSDESDDDISIDDSDVQIFDPAVASAPAGAQRRTSAGKVDPNAATIVREESTDKRTYQLMYENGRWKLLTELDPKTEESIKVAFDRALESQI